jgi:hypothetical protein
MTGGFRLSAALCIRQFSFAKREGAGLASGPFELVKVIRSDLEDQLQTKLNGA